MLKNRSLCTIALLMIIVACRIVSTYANTEPIKFYSQFKQDEYIYNRFFNDKKNGVFIDFGAHDGISLSNTYFFEKQQGWTGICIEPIPAIFEQLQKNRSCTCINACIAPISGQQRFWIVGTEAKNTQMLSGLIDAYDPRHIQRIYSESRGEGQEILVDCYTLNALLEEHGITHVDYISIDTEGGELEILKSIDFDTYTIDIIDVENNYNDPAFRTFLESKGYVFITKMVIDEIYAHRSFLEKQNYTQ